MPLRHQGAYRKGDGMNTNYVPIIINNTESNCPNCGKTEEIIEVCKHCGHIYKTSDFSWWYVILFILAFLIFAWILCTILSWCSDCDLGVDNPTLLSKFKEQFEFIKSLRLF